MLGGLGMSPGLAAGELPPMPAAAPAGAPGIQERLPAMPGMQRRQRGEPRRDRTQGSVAQALRSCPPPTPPAGDAPAALGTEPGVAPIQERLPRLTPADGFAPAPAPSPREAEPVASPPPSPPVPVLPSSPDKKGIDARASSSRSLVVAAQKKQFESRLQTYPQVLPKPDEKKKKMVEEEPGDLTWDDRSPFEILKGAFREHTLAGFVSACLYGTGPKLATSFQAAQLLWSTVLGMLFLAVAQLRYSWLGAQWAGTVLDFDTGVTGDLMERLPVLYTISVASAVVGYPFILIFRWLFLVANRTFSTATKKQAIIIFGSVWCIALLTFGGLAIAAVEMATHMEATLVRADVMVSWALGALSLWIIFEPVVLLVFAAVNLLLKWCTSFEDLPEVREEAFKQKALEKMYAKEHKAEAEKAEAAKPKDPPAKQPLKALTQKKGS